MRRHRNVKIVATLGPSSRTKRQIRSMIKAGVDVFRLNFSHGSHEDHRSRFNAIRQLEKEFFRKTKNFEINIIQSVKDKFKKNNIDSGHITNNGAKYASNKIQILIEKLIK